MLAPAAGAPLGLLAGLLIVSASPAYAASSHVAWVVIAQATPDPNGSQVDQSDDEEDDNSVPIPPNLLEPEPKTAPPDTSGAAAARSDSTGNIVPAIPTAPETLRYVPPGEKPGDDAKGATAPPGLVPVAPKHRGGLFGLTPAVVILGLAVAHFFVVKAVK
jgi:hypothetical protein